MKCIKKGELTVESTEWLMKCIFHLSQFCENKVPGSLFLVCLQPHIICRKISGEKIFYRIGEFYFLYQVGLKTLYRAIKLRTQYCGFTDSDSQELNERYLCMEATELSTLLTRGFPHFIFV